MRRKPAAPRSTRIASLGMELAGVVLGLAVLWSVSPRLSVGIGAVLLILASVFLEELW